MNFSVPSNVIPWLFGAIVLIPLGIRAWIHSRKIKTPTTRYFALTGLLGGFALAFYSFPSVFTDSPTLLKAGFVIGIPLLYSMLIYQSYYVWYAVLQKKISYLYLLVPVAAIGLYAMITDVQDALKDNVRIENNELIFSFLPLSRLLQSTLLLLVLVNGLYFLKQSFSIKDMGGKLRFLSLGILYTLVAISTIMDNLFYQGDSDSVLLYYGYIFSAIVFFVTLLIVILKNKKSPNQR